MKKFLIQAIAILLVVFGALAYSTGKLPEINLVNKPKLTEVKIKEIKIKVEVADTAEKRRQGLGGRDSLAADSGMLFKFPKPDYYNFWMKGMKFSIDIIWLKEGRIVEVSKNVSVPEPGKTDEELPIYTPSQPIDSALEVVAGFSDSHGINIGDSIEVTK